MVSAKVKVLCVFCVVVCALSPVSTVFAKDGKSVSGGNAANNNGATVASADFHWDDHQKLSWTDFQGPVKAETDESAAATHCGIGFRINNNTPSGKPEVVVYNTFYINKSWVRPDAKISSILDHEQGHFDLCEIYTRKLREKMSRFNFNVPDVKGALMNIYAEVTNEYESRQQAYEYETTHGTNIPQQRKWMRAISVELN